MSSDTEKDMGLDIQQSRSEEGRGKMSQEEQAVAEAAARYGYGPLSHGNQLNSFGSAFHPGMYQAPEPRKFANPAPLGLSAFALTTFVLSLINMQARGIKTPNLVVASALGYGGLVQLLAGMWEMAVGNTFGATALSSYGGFWISYGIIYTPGGFEILDKLTKTEGATGVNAIVGFWLAGWFIFTTLMLLLTLKSTWAFFSLFFSLDLAFLLLTIGHFVEDAPGKTSAPIIKAGGFFGLVAAFLAWYNAIAGIADEKNSFIKYPLGPLPWATARRAKTEREVV